MNAAPAWEAERAARAVLSASVDPGLPAVTEAVAALGASEALRRLVSGALGRSDQVVARAAAADGAALLDRALAAGVRFVVPADHEWPGGLDRLAVAGARDGIGGLPFGLWVRGPAAVGALGARGVAVVGSRAASSYGVHVAGELAADLAERGVLVVSGAAYGIDAAAHRGALAAGGVTVAVLACGVDVPYPRGHATLLDRIVGEGAVVSELPPGQGPTRRRFLARNRVLAAACAGTVVVEAALRSGARSTARWADRCGAPLMAVPGPVTSALSAGCHEEVREGCAVLVTGGADVLELVGELSTDAVGWRRGPQRAWDDLPGEVAAVFEALAPRAAAATGAVAAAADLAVPVTLSALARLELIGLAERTVEGWRLGPAARPPGPARGGA